jgi:hypothetical protein
MASASIVSILGIVASLASSAVTTHSSIQQNEAQEDILKYQARVERDQAAQVESRARRQAQVELGRQRAVLGKLGVLPTAGSPLEQLAYNAGEAERGAVLAGRGLLNQASLLQAQSSVVSSQRGYLATAGVLSGITTAAEYASPLLQQRPRTSSTHAGQPYARPGLG